MIQLAFILFLILTGPAVSQQINIRSGAHDTFARLVLDAPPGIEWSLTQGPTGAKLTLEGHQDGFDSSSIFQRIDTSFISSVSVDVSSIRVGFGCDCSAEVFNADNGMIVLDVSIASPIQANDFDENLLGFVGNRALSFEQTQQVNAALQSQDQVLTSDPVPVVPNVKNVETSQQFLPFEPILSSPDFDSLRDARSTIARQIGTAATRGILDPVNNQVTRLIRPSPPQIDTQVFETSREVVKTPPSSEAEIRNIRISTSDSKPIDIGNNIKSLISDGVNCIDPKRVDISSWGEAQSISQSISRLRSQLYGEFDELKIEAVLELTRTYLYFGFGAEARQTLLLDRDLKSRYPELLNIADVLEYGYSQSSEYLYKFMECESDVALWSILSVPNISPTRSINVDAILRGASALPIHLRSVLVPELSRRLLEYGDAESASAALRSLERAPQALTPNANLAKANIELAENSTSLAQERLSKIVTSNTEQSAKALIKFVDSHLAEDSEIDENVATLVEAYAQEMRDDPLEAELRRTHVLALGKSGQFSAAFDALHRMRTRKKQSGEDILRSSVLDLLIRSADDVDFLEHTFEQIEIAPESLIPETRFELSKRLAKLGFWKQAEITINSGTGYPDKETIALLRAEISLALDRPLEASAHLFGLESKEASYLRAKAEASAGNFSSAHQIYTDIGSSKQEVNAAWLAQDWDARLEDATPVFGPMVSVAQNQLEDRVEREGMLERTTLAIAESKSAREAIQNLLGSEELQLSELD